MADTIQIRGGNKANMPKLADRELGYVRDEEALYVGTPTGNVKVGQKIENTVNELATAMSELSAALVEQQAEMDENQMSAADAQEPLANEATVADVVAAFNGLIAAMKASGLMKEG